MSSVHLEIIFLLTFSQISVQLVQMAAGFLFVYFVICLEQCPTTLSNTTLGNLPSCVLGFSHMKMFKIKYYMG